MSDSQTTLGHEAEPEDLPTVKEVKEAKTCPFYDAPYYPIEGKSPKGSPWLAFFQMDRMPGRVWKRLLRTLAEGSALEDVGGGELEIQPAQRDAVRAEVLDHFRQIVGLASNAPTEQQKAWLKKNPATAWKVWTDGYMGAQASWEAPEALDILASFDRFEVPIRRKLYKPSDGGDIFEAIVTYRFQEETPSHRNRFDSAVSARINTNTRTRRATEDLEVLEVLFDELVIGEITWKWGSDSGSERVTKELLKRIPFGDKYLAIKEFFGISKN